MLLRTAQCTEYSTAWSRGTCLSRWRRDPSILPFIHGLPECGNAAEARHSKILLTTRLLPLRFQPRFPPSILISRIPSHRLSPPHPRLHSRVAFLNRRRQARSAPCPSSLVLANPPDPLLPREHPSLLPCSSSLRSPENTPAPALTSHTQQPWWNSSPARRPRASRMCPRPSRPPRPPSPPSSRKPTWWKPSVSPVPGPQMPLLWLAPRLHLLACDRPGNSVANKSAPRPPGGNATEYVRTHVSRILRMARRGGRKPRWLQSLPLLPSSSPRILLVSLDPARARHCERVAVSEPTKS